MALPKFYTVEQVAALTHAPEKSVLYWIYSGKLESVRAGRRRLVTVSIGSSHPRYSATIRASLSTAPSARTSKRVAPYANPSTARRVRVARSPSGVIPGP